MSDAARIRLADELSRELDLLVFRLERTPPADPAEFARSWSELRRQIERLQRKAEALSQLM